MKDSMGKKNLDDSSNQKDKKINTSKQLTPTKDHPLMDLDQCSKEKKYSDDSDEDDKTNIDEHDDDTDEMAQKMKLGEIEAEAARCDHMNTNVTILLDSRNHQSTTFSNPDDETNNNKQIEADDDVDEINDKRKESASRLNNNNVNIKNNNPRDQPETRTTDELNKFSAEKINGKLGDNRWHSRMH